MPSAGATPQDVIYLSPPGELHTVFLVCDGHGGPDAAQATVDHLPRMLQSELPAALPDFSNRAGQLSPAKHVLTCMAAASAAAR
jgi:serine/threonine protein phosphatase PrpC